MGWHEIEACTIAHEADENEKLVMLMNCMAVAYGGTAKQRKQMANVLLGISNDFNIDEFESMMASQFLATPEEETEESKDIKAWAADEFDKDDPAFKVK